MTIEYKHNFPYDKIRDQQQTAIEFAVKNLIEDDKKFVILECGTGVGKSAIGYTVAKTLLENLEDNDDYENGSYFVTTQKILQDQYIKDFGDSLNKDMLSIKSSSNYKCKYYSKNTCADSIQKLRTAERTSRFYKACNAGCIYKIAKRKFIESKLGVTNFSYFLTESTFSGGIVPQKVLVVDEAHNLENEIGKFVQFNISEFFAKNSLHIEMPPIKTQFQSMQWIQKEYLPALKNKIIDIHLVFKKFSGLKSKLGSDFEKISKQVDLLESHSKKMEKFIEIYDKENWVMEINVLDKNLRRLEFKPVDVSKLAYDHVFRFGQKVILMSATILNHEGFCEQLGIPVDEVSFVSIPSPFPITNKPVFALPVGKMSAAHIDNTLPKLKNAIEILLAQHPNEKGVIHAHTFKIAKYLKENIKDKRLLYHTSHNRDKVLNKHIRSRQPTVLISPSMTEGVDLKGDLSRFQVICKIPYPYLGDKIVKKRMNKWKWWYSLQTVKTIVQAVGRSIRSKDDSAITYILDGDWNYFYDKNREVFPLEFRRSIKR